MINLVKILAKLKGIWELWNLRGFILFSFSLQCILIVGSSLRIQTSRSLIHRWIWLVYLLADWAAYYAIGLVVPINRLEDANTYDIHSFWAPFLLLHIGGPNTIAGFSLEDNELWDRSVLHIAVQAGATIIAIVRSLSKKRLLAPTLLVFVAAFTRYVGRILALYKGSLDSLRDSIRNEGRARPAQGGSNDSRSIEPDVAMVTHSYELFQKFKGVFCGLSIKTDGEVLRVRERLYTLMPKQAFIEMEIELGLAYGLFYTKIWTIIEDKVGRILHLISLASEVAALFLWVLANKDVYQKVDVKLTNALLFGGVFLDMVSMLKLMFSDLVICHLIKLCPNSRFVASALNTVLSAKNQKWAKRLVLFRRWSGSIKQFNLIEYKENQRSCCGSSRLLKMFDRVIGFERDVSIKELKGEVKNHIFRNIKLRAVHWQPESRKLEKQTSRVLAEYVLEMYDEKELLANAMKQICKGLGVVDALIIWHATTHLFYSKWEDVKPLEGNETIFCKCNKQLSNYLMYLLFHQPKMILEGAQLDMTVEDMIHHLEEIKKVVSEIEINNHSLDDEDMLDTQRLQRKEKEAMEMQTEDIRNILSPQNSGEGSVQFIQQNSEEGSVQLIWNLASYIAKKHELSEQTEAIMSEIWIDLLLYAAGRCRGRTHVQQLGNGGELLTVVWLMITHLDLTIKLPD